jgi:hypothetical protein
MDRCKSFHTNDLGRAGPAPPTISPYATTTYDDCLTLPTKTGPLKTFTNKDDFM